METGDGRENRDKKGGGGGESWMMLVIMDMDRDMDMGRVVGALWKWPMLAAT